MPANKLAENGSVVRDTQQQPEGSILNVDVASRHGNATIANVALKKARRSSPCGNVSLCSGSGDLSLRSASF